MTSTQKIAALIWFLVCITITVMAFTSQDMQTRMLYANGVQLLGALLGVFLCLRTMSVFPSGSPLRGVWALVGLGVLAWGIGQAYFASYPLLHNGEDTPYPSLADVGFLLVQPLIVIALLRLYIVAGLQAPAWGKGLAFLALALTGYISAIFNWEGMGSTDLAMVAVSFCYMVFDPVLLAVTILLASGFSGSNIGRAWWYVAAGIVLYFIGNLAYTNMVFNETYVTGSAIDPLWPLGFGLIGFGAVKAREMFLED